MAIDIVLKKKNNTSGQQLIVYWLNQGLLISLHRIIRLNVMKTISSN